MTTRAVLFDLGNTLVHYYSGTAFRPILRQCLMQTAALAGTAVTESLFEQALLLNREDPTFAVRPLANRVRALFPEAEHIGMDALSREFMAPIFACARVDTSAHEVLDKLHSYRIKTAIVSNTPCGSPAELWREELRRHGLLERVETAVFCVDAGWRKPHPAPFRLALERLGVSPQEAIFVGDDPRWDVEGAKRAGIRPVLISPGESTERPPTAIRHLESVLSLV